MQTCFTVKVHNATGFAGAIAAPMTQAVYPPIWHATFVRCHHASSHLSCLSEQSPTAAEKQVPSIKLGMTEVVQQME